MRRAAAPSRTLARAGWLRSGQEASESSIPRGRRERRRRRVVWRRRHGRRWPEAAGAGGTGAIGVASARAREREREEGVVWFDQTSDPVRSV
jgi:hypothetical protein